MKDSDFKEVNEPLKAEASKPDWVLVLSDPIVAERVLANLNTVVPLQAEKSN